MPTAFFSSSQTRSWFFNRSGCHDFFIFKSPPPILPTLSKVQKLKRGIEDAAAKSKKVGRGGDRKRQRASTASRAAHGRALRQLPCRASDFRAEGPSELTSSASPSPDATLARLSRRNMSRIPAVGNGTLDDLEAGTLPEYGAPQGARCV